MTTIYMTPNQWAAIPDNPIQRDTEAHARKAVRGHLRKPSSSQWVVHAAALPDNTMVKLDGHTRSLLWSDGRLPAPATVEVVLHQVASMERAIDLYKEFDSPSAAEGATDRLSGAFRLHGIAPRNRLLTQGGVTSAMAILEFGRTIYEMVGDWKVELMLLDTLDVAPKTMPATLICAALATLRRHGSGALDFWILYANGGGTRIDGRSCGVDELTRIVADLRGRNLLGSGGSTQRQAQAGRAISCCDAWLQGRSFIGSAKATDLRMYLAAAHRKRVVGAKANEGQVLRPARVSDGSRQFA